MKIFKRLAFGVLITAFLLSSCSGTSQNDLDQVQATLNALSMQVTVEAMVEQTAEASAATNNNGNSNNNNAGNNGGNSGAGNGGGNNGGNGNGNDSAVGPASTATVCNSYANLSDLQDAVILALTNKNFAPLAQDNLISEFVSIGYWQSEGRGFTANELVQELSENMLPANAPHNVPFTIEFNTGQFPPTEGGPEWIDMFGPDSVAVLYSSGWGSDGAGEAMLYFRQNECGGYEWYRTMYAFFGFSPVALGPPPIAPSCSVYGSLLDFETALIDALDSRDFNQLIVDGMIHDPIGIGYYLSEGVDRTPFEMEQDLVNIYLPASNLAVFNATNDVSSFPPDGGFPWFDYLGPDTIAVIYTTGWDADGTGEAFLYLKEDGCGNIIWFGMLYSFFGFP